MNLAYAICFGALYSPVGANQSSNFPEELEATHFSPNLRAAAVTSNLRHYYYFDGGGQHVSVKRSIRDTGGDWLHYNMTPFTTSYQVTAVASREGDKELYVAGIKRGGEDVIEKWTFSDRSGGYGLRSTSTSYVIGTPSPIYMASEVTHGGAFSDPGNLVVPAPAREVLIEGTLGHVRCIEVDPEGRFLLYQAHDTHALMKFSLEDPNAVPQVLLTVVDVPHLEKTTTLKVMRGETVDRRYFMTEQPPIGMVPLGEAYTMIDDANNDGILDTPVTTISATYKASPVGQENWTSFYFLPDEVGPPF